jgi:ADP-ribose pyrophosphatase
MNSSIAFATPWFEVVEKKLDSEAFPYYALRMQDYVTVVAITAEKDVVLVRQFRPAVERYTLELPSGHVELDEPPEQAARRELAEETGFRANRLTFLGTLFTDTGRMENRLWCFLAPKVKAFPEGFRPEPSVERVLVPQSVLMNLIGNTEFNHALDLAVIMLAIARLGEEWSGSR